MGKYLEESANERGCSQFRIFDQDKRKGSRIAQGSMEVHSEMRLASNPTKKIKPKKCKVPTCRAEFIPSKPLQSVCSPQCAGIWAGILRERNVVKERTKARKERRDSMEKIKGKGDLEAEAEKACNAFIRYRDRKDPCISCGEYSLSGYYDAGHFRAKSVEPALRYHPDNIHKQCVRCNQHMHGNLTMYEQRLISKIGPEKVEWLKGSHPAAHFTHEELRQIRDGYKAELKKLKK